MPNKKGGFLSMKQCEKCQTELAEEQNVCPNCGEDKERTDLLQEEVVSEKGADESNTGNVDSAVIKEHAHHYWSYLRQTLKTPLKKDHAGQWWYGLVSVGLISLFTAFCMARLVSASPYSGLFSDSNMMETLGMFFKIFIATGIQLALLAGVSYGFNHLVMKNEMEWKSFSLYFFNLLNGSIIVTAIMAILSIIGYSVLDMITYLAIFNLMIYFVAFLVTIVFNENKSRLDTFYLALASGAVAGAVLLFFVRIIFASLLGSFF